MRKTNWVVYAKEPFAGPQQVVEYLGRYSHKVAISNHRIFDISDRGVTFGWRDYRDGNQKVMTLADPEFLRRFAQHMLPKRFVRIRHYGLLSASNRPFLRELQQTFGRKPAREAGKKDWKEICRAHPGFDPDLCPCCDKGLMVVIQYLDPGRAPPGNLTFGSDDFLKTAPL
ncbi:MAG: transposase [Bacteroidales bacterium]|nr:transposase [Bacteroidales bacterium]